MTALMTSHVGPVELIARTDLETEPVWIAHCTTCGHDLKAKPFTSLWWPRMRGLFMTATDLAVNHVRDHHRGT